MIRLIHTADWHIGQTFFGYERKEEHISFFRWLKKIIRDRSADVLLVSGDVFDSPNPSAESQKLYYKFLYEVTQENPFLQIIIIAGNHDSAARLEAPSPLFKGMNITVRGVIKRTSEGEIDYNHLIIPLIKNGKTEACCLAVPYLRQGDYPQAENYALGVSLLYKELISRARLEAQCLVVMGHLQVIGSEISEDDRSERAVIGGLEAVSPQIFREGAAYVALGHLHRAQKVTSPYIRYAGSPLPMSFAEKNYKQSVTGITLSSEDEVGKEIIETEILSFEPPVKLLSLPTQALPIDRVLAELMLLPKGEVCSSSPYLEVKVVVNEPEPAMKYKIQEVLKDKAVRLARIVAMTPQKSESNYKFNNYEELQAVHPIDIACDFYGRKYGGGEMPDELKTLLNKIISEVTL